MLHCCGFSLALERSFKTVYVYRTFTTVYKITLPYLQVAVSCRIGQAKPCDLVDVEGKSSPEINKIMRCTRSRFLFETIVYVEFADEISRNLAAPVVGGLLQNAICPFHSSTLP